MDQQSDGSGASVSTLTESAVAFQLEMHQSLVPLSWSSQGGCHLSYGAQSHIMHTVYTVYEQKNTKTNTHKERSGN